MTHDRLGPQLVESVDVEPQTQKADYKIIPRYSAAWRADIPNPGIL